MRLASAIFLLAVASVAASRAGATDLVEAWRAAQEHDPQYLAARAAHEAGGARRQQASALWRPSVAISGTAGRMSSNTEVSGAQFATPAFGRSDGVAFDTSVNNGASGHWAVSARQPLFNLERLAQGRQLDLSAGAADLEWQGAQQSLIVRTAERYFALALAQETLNLLREQQAAAERARDEAQERFRVGDAPITDTEEANARALALSAQVLAAEAELQLQQAALADLTGLAPAQLHPQVPDSALDPSLGETRPLERWIAEVTQNNPRLRSQAAAVDIARQEANRYRAYASPSLDLVAEMGRDHLGGTGDFGPASNVTSNRMIGLQLTVPVFTGGYRSARLHEANSLADKEQELEAGVRQQVAQQTRASWLGLTVGARRVQALEQALQASHLRLEATRLGHEVGDRTTLDLLNAQSDASAAQRDLLQARVALILDRLRLAEQAGALDESTLLAVNAGLATRGAKAND